MVTLTKISTCGHNSAGASTPQGGTIGKTTKGHGMYTLVHGTGSNRKSITMHCSQAQAEAQKARYSKD